MKITDIIKVPSPKELGKTNRDSLPSSLFGSIKEGEYTWETWHTEMKRDYPIRYFIFETIPLFYWSLIKNPIKEFIYYILSHIQPSKRYHMLDLRDKISGYKYGWLDADVQMLNACFNILKNFVEKECPSIISWVNSHKDLDSDTSETDIKVKREIVELCCWWVWGRAKDQEELHRLFDIRHISEEDKKKSRELMAKMSQDEKDMLPRLIAIREYLWT